MSVKDVGGGVMSPLIVVVAVVVEAVEYRISNVHPTQSRPLQQTRDRDFSIVHIKRRPRINPATQPCQSTRTRTAQLKYHSIIRKANPFGPVLA